MSSAKKSRPGRGRKAPAQRTGRPTTLPRWGGAVHEDAHLNPARQERHRIEAAFLEEHGRPMNRKDWKRRQRAAQATIPALLDLNAMAPGAKP